jgi:hypothetical protein
VATQPAILVGLLVLLNNADWLSLQPGSDKLKELYEGPYCVLRVFNNGLNVKLELPEGNQRHSTFHVSKVKKFVEDMGLREDLLSK